MEWRDEGAILTVRGHGETSAIIEVFTAAHGRHAGVVRGGASRKVAPVLQPGNQVAVVWRARLGEHIGSYTVEPLRSRTSQVLTDPLALAALNAVSALLTLCLAERDPQPGLYLRTLGLLDMLGQGDHWPVAYLRWEMALLDALGFGLDLSACAVTGAVEGLTHVSPRTGRAVSHTGAGDWADRLLPLPPEMLGQGVDRGGVVAGLATTGHFLTAKVLPSFGDRPVPAARDRLVDLLSRSAGA
jgi:DNA repair protein RecO (recombination protein O)